jgi:lipid A disaccharide synthetase
MTKGSREKDIKLLVTKFMKLVESLNPGERLSIRKVAAKKKTTRKKITKKSARAAG